MFENPKLDFLFTADACDYACDYGVIGPRAKNTENTQNAIGDKKLAHSAQMFHYQHQKQQIIAMENRNAEMNQNNDDDNDSDDNENDFTVYGGFFAYYLYITVCDTQRFIFFFQ